MMLPNTYYPLIKRAMLISMYVFAFLLTLSIPFVKTFLLGEIDTNLQRQFIIYFFVIQFVTPIINFGLGWAKIRKFIECGQQEVFQVAKPTILLIAILPLFSFKAFIIAIICLLNTYFTFNLQILRLKGSRWTYYGLRLGRGLLEIVSVLTFVYSATSKTISIFILFELLVLIIITTVMFVYLNDKIKIDKRYFPYSRDFAYMAIKTVKANMFRITLPFLFPYVSFDKLFFILLGYEMVSQFVSINFSVQLMKNPTSIRLLLIFCLITLPFQILSILTITHVFQWTVEIQEIIFILIVGNVSLLTTAIISLIKNGQFNQYYRFLIFQLAASFFSIGCAIVLQLKTSYLLGTLLIPIICEAIYLVFRLYCLQKEKST